MIRTSLSLLLAGLVGNLFSSPVYAAWKQFRGPDGQGHASVANLPERWSESENVAWKAAIPGTGWSSPVVDGQQIWLTSAQEEGQSLRAVCLDRDSGELLHNVEVFRISDPESINPKNSYASPTACLDDNHVYVHFGTYGTACLDRASGKIVWSTQSLQLDHKEGPGSSPALFKDRLIIPCDGLDVQFVAALATKTGDVLWKTNRSGTLNPNPDFRKAYSTPVVIESQGRAEAICVGADQVIAYDPANGAEIWKVRYKGFSNVPVPVLGGDRIFVCSDYARPNLIAIRLGGAGDITESHVLWKVSRQVSAIPSALYLDRKIYMVSNGGVFSSLDADTGETLFQQRLGGNFAASPVFGDGKLFLVNEAGETTVVNPPREVLSVNKLDGQVLATPALDGDALFLRTSTHLYKITK